VNRQYAEFAKASYPKIRVHAPFVFKCKSLLLPIGPDGCDPTEGFLEVSINGAFCDAVKSLQLSRGPQIVSLNIEV
jgi:hypothetical protein